MRIVIDLSRRQVLFSSLLAAIGAGAYAIAAETRVESTLPAPSGVFRRLITTAQTVLAREEGSVGIGVASPQAKLHVKGSIIVDDGKQAPDRVFAADAAGRGEWKDLGALLDKPSMKCPEDQAVIGFTSAGVQCKKFRIVPKVCKCCLTAVGGCLKGGCQPSAYTVSSCGYSRSVNPIPFSLVNTVGPQGTTCSVGDDVSLTGTYSRDCVDADTP